MDINLNYLPRNTRSILEELAGAKFIKKFYLAGGTAAALFLNHRRSDDLDFFSEKEFNTPILISRLKKIGKFESIQSPEYTLIGKLNNIKISFFALPYGLLEAPIKYKNLSIAKPIDLATMKILAISDRGTKRDFIDLYFLVKKIKPLNELLYLFQKKFGEYDYNIYHIIKSLTYFKDAENEKMPKMRVDIIWGKVKIFFEKEKFRLVKEFLII